MTRLLSFRWTAAVLLAVVLGQISSCCCCLGGAVIPPVTPVSPSTELARGLRDRLNEVKSQPGPFEVVVTDLELTSYVVGLLQSGAGEFPARDMQIRFGSGLVEIWATFVDIAPTEVPIYVQGTVHAADGDLVFKINKAHAGAFPVPGALRETIAQILSESLAELELGLKVERVEITSGKMFLAGQVTGNPPDLP
jgi:hypothetical protein